jgi:hypothetical protein
MAMPAGKRQIIPDYTMKALKGVEILLLFILTSALGAGEWSTSRSDHFTPCN